METIPLFTPDQQLRALSWKQPFADLMLHGKIETRTWPTKYRGWVLICASKKPYNHKEILSISGLQTRRIRETLPMLYDLYLNDHLGKAIAIGYLSDCRLMVKTDEDRCFVNHYFDLWCHVYEHVIPLREPMPWKGSQGWREVPLEFKNTIYKLIQPVSEDCPYCGHFNPCNNCASKKKITETSPYERSENRNF